MGPFPPKSILKKYPSNRSLFDHAWGHVRDHTTPETAISSGVGINEAQHWHHRAYGLGELPRMLPAEIGHAAAYEAFRTWMNNSSMYQPLSGDVHRQREGLIGLAVGEAARLLSFTGRQSDNYVRFTASESAAATASNIFYESREEGGGYRRSRSRTRISTDPYDNDNVVTSAYGGHYRSHSRHRSRSHSRPPALQLGTNVMGMPPPQFSGSHYAPSITPESVSSYDDSPTYGSFPAHSMHMNLPTHGTPYPHNSMSLPGTAASYQATIPGQPYQGHLQPYQTQIYPSHSYSTQPTQTLPMTRHTSHESLRGRSVSIPYPQQSPYASTTYGNGPVLGQPPPQVIVIKQPSSSRKHKHHHSHGHGHGHRYRSSSRASRRSRSISPYEDHYPDNYRRMKHV
ncbi:hypothetical protein H0H93_015984 [Arthromyces matolae]|nr:hypothetical protein H0H93_015984 [Arthromyces matolae]